MKPVKAFFHWFFATRIKRWLFVYTPLALFLIVFYCNYIVSRSAEGKVYASIDDLPAKKTALVFGTSPRRATDDKNLFYIHRMRAVAALWRAGKVKHILVSGDNSTHDYDEPTAMKKSLVELGIPDSAITVDYAGFRTLDSVVRCKWVFGQDDVILVSQAFQNERALFIAAHFGINAVAWHAQDVPSTYSLKTTVREYFARVKAVLDIYLLNTQPKFPGPPEPIL